LDAISAAKSGVVSAIARFDGASADLTNAFTGRDNADPAIAVVEQANARNALRASLATLKTANKTFKALLDIKV
jgi:hypothetical protein